MYALTRKKGDIDSGIYASVDINGTRIIQFFEEEDDAVTYNTHLHALGYNLEVTKTPSENIDKFCMIADIAYTVVEAGELVFPRLEKLQDIL